MAPARVIGSASQAGSQRSTGGGSKGSSRSASQDASTAPTTPRSDQNECSQTNLTEDIQRIAAYLADESTPASVAKSWKSIRDAIEKLPQRAGSTNAELAVQEIRSLVQKLANQAETTCKPSYAAAAAAAVAGQTPAQSRTEA